jgi:hypothetical protein
MITTMPDELILEILSHLAINDLKNISLTSKNLYNIAQENELWQNLFLKLEAKILMTEMATAYIHFFNRPKQYSDFKFYCANLLDFIHQQHDFANDLAAIHRHIDLYSPHFSLDTRSYEDMQNAYQMIRLYYFMGEFAKAEHCLNNYYMDLGDHKAIVLTGMISDKLADQAHAIYCYSTVIGDYRQGEYDDYYSQGKEDSYAEALLRRANIYYQQNNGLKALEDYKAFMHCIESMAKPRDINKPKYLNYDIQLNVKLITSIQNKITKLEGKLPARKCDASFFAKAPKAGSNDGFFSRLYQRFSATNHVNDEKIAARQELEKMHLKL